jgi:glucose/arabinose dehydrogenase
VPALRAVAPVGTIVLAAALLASPQSLAATVLPAGYTMTTVVSFLTDPTTFDFAPNGDIFIGEKSGKIQILRAGTVLVAGTIPVSTLDEEGITGISVDPDYATNGNLWVYYTTPSPLRQRLSRFTIANDLLTAEAVIVEYPVTRELHHAGCIRFAADKTIYVSTGDDGGFSTFSQNPFDLRGKILHVNRDGTGAAGNPYLSGTSGDPRVYALGFRHPWRISLQPGTGNLFIPDIGAGAWEELDLGIPGGNYGWSTVEGPEPPGQAGFVYPIYSYPHTDPPGNSIIGGDFAQAGDFSPDSLGQYFFGDEAALQLRRLVLDGSNNVTLAEVWATGVPDPVEIRFGPDGALYFMSFNNGALYKVAFTGGANRQPQAVGTATPAAGLAPLLVTLDGSGSSDPDQQPLQYLWNTGHGGVTGTTAVVQHSYPIGVFFATLTVNDGQGGVNSTAPLRIVSGNRAPAASITSPADETHYNAGATFFFSGTGSDPEDGTLGCSAMSWSVTFHHAGHVHPFLGPIEGVCNGSFTIPRTGEASADTYYEITLRVTDSGAPLGSSATVTTTTAVQVRPNTAVMTFNTTPNPNLEFSLDGTLLQAPQSIGGVADFLRTLSTPSPQAAADGHNYSFVSWSDGGMQTHTLVTPAFDTTYMASFACNVITEVPNVMLTTASGGQIALTWQPSGDPCATTGLQRYHVYAGASARPANGAGQFPTDPPFVLRGVTGSASFTYLPDPSDSFFLVLEMGMDGTEGLVGHYGK